MSDIIAPAPRTSWQAASDEPGRLAASDAAHFTAKTIMNLMEADRRRKATVQWMPDESGQGCRFEVIDVNSGDYIDVVHIDADGHIAVKL